VSCPTVRPGGPYPPGRRWRILIAVPAPLVSNFLKPSGAFVVAVLVSLIGFGLLVVWSIVGRRATADRLLSVNQ
jgi:hypothetical protein